MSQGHSWNDLKTYTLSELGVFIRESVKQEELFAKNTILTTWMGFNVDKKYIDNLFKTANNNNTKHGKRKESISSEDAQKEWKRLANRLSQLGM